MRRTPAYLKGLAEVRARAAGDMDRLQKLYDEIGADLAKAQGKVASCDLLIRDLDARLEPERIPNIKGWQGRYGKRGVFRAAIKRHLQEAWPDAITTLELCWKLQLEFRLDFPTPAEEVKWRHHSVSSVLKFWTQDGQLERLHVLGQAKGLKPEVGLWRWKPECAGSLESLLSLSAAA